MKGSRRFVCFMLFVLLAGCSSTTTDKADDYRGAGWGMTVDEVVAIEKEKGNELYETDEEQGDELTLSYSGIVVNGFTADADYKFVNSTYVNPFLILEAPKMAKLLIEATQTKASEERLTEINTELEEYFKKHKKKREEFENIDTALSLDEFRLQEGSYYFDEDVDSDALFDSLVEKYGDPEKKDESASNSKSFSWKTGRTKIFYDGEKYISYEAEQFLLDEFAQLKPANKSKNEDGL